MNRPAYLIPASTRFMLSAAAFVVIIAGLKASQQLLAPFLLSIFIAVLATPPLFFFQKKGLSTPLALLLVTAGVVAAGIALAALIGGSLDDFSSNLPRYQEKLKLLTGNTLAWLQAKGVQIPDRALTTYLDPAKAMRMAGKMLSGLGGVLANTFLILLTVIFILFEASSVPAKLKAALRRPDASMEHFAAIVRNINNYMVIKTTTSLVTGVVVAVMLAVVGVDYPVMWGTLAFMLNYVPNIGSVIAALPAVLLALIQISPTAALVVAAGYLVINIVIGNVVEPRFMGEGLGLSTLIVFLSLVFWGWVLGPVGMFLSVPLTMTLKIVLDANKDTRPIAILLGPTPRSR